MEDICIPLHELRSGAGTICGLQSLFRAFEHSFCMLFVLGQVSVLSAMRFTIGAYA